MLIILKILFSPLLQILLLLLDINTRAVGRRGQQNELKSDEAGVYKSRLTNFHEISRTHCSSISLLSSTTWDTNTCTFSYVYDIMNKTAQKMVKRQFLKFKDVTRFDSVIGIVSYFSWQLNFPGASIKFQEISWISRNCRHPAREVAVAITVCWAPYKLRKRRNGSKWRSSGDMRTYMRRWCKVTVI